MKIKSVVQILRSAASASVSACGREEYMEACLRSLPLPLSPGARSPGREYAEAIRENGIWLASVKTLPSQARLLLRAARAAARGEPAWQIGASPGRQKSSGRSWPGRGLLRPTIMEAERGPSRPTSVRGDTPLTGPRTPTSTDPSWVPRAPPSWGRPKARVFLLAKTGGEPGIRICTHIGYKYR
jgi:hypothetical protein